jgi:hypothetical protein
MADEGEKEEARQVLAKEREVEQNKIDALDMAAKLFKIMTNPEMVKLTTPTERHQIAIKKSKNFAQAFPLILAKLSRDLKYNHIAFRRYLDRVHKNPGKGMEGFIENQAMYARFLYEEECKANGRHINPKIAMQIFNTEHNHMSSWVKEIKTKESDAKNAFDDETVKATSERKEEFLDWLNELSPPPLESSGAFDLMADDSDYQESLKSASVESQDEPLEIKEVKEVKEVKEALVLREAALLREKQKKQDEVRLDWLTDTNMSAWKNQKKNGDKK